MTVAGQAFLFTGELFLLSFAAIFVIWFADRLRRNFIGKPQHRLEGFDVDQVRPINRAAGLQTGSGGRVGPGCFFASNLISLPHTAARAGHGLVLCLAAAATAPHCEHAGDGY